MGLIRPWLKAELESILQVGANDKQPSHPRCRNRFRKQHVQCIEVDEKRSALKINDTESMVWCFVSTPGMEKVSHKRGKTPRGRLWQMLTLQRHNTYLRNAVINSINGDL